MVYVPPDGNAAKAAAQIADCVQNQLQRTPCASVFIMGDFNHCKLELALPGYDQYVRCETQDRRILDKCYGNVKKAYTAKAKPPLSNSDHNMIHLILTYRTVFKSSKPEVKTISVWSENSVETLKGCFLSTDWEILQNGDIHEATVTTTEYIKFCEDNVLEKKCVTVFPNNKPYITKEIKECINWKKQKFKEKDWVGLRVVQKELTGMLRGARKRQKEILEQKFTSTSSKKLWDTIKVMTNMNTRHKHLCTNNDLEKANELNEFYLRFDIQDHSQEGMYFPETSVSEDTSFRVIIDPQKVC